MERKETISEVNLRLSASAVEPCGTRIILRKPKQPPKAQLSNKCRKGKVCFLCETPLFFSEALERSFKHHFSTLITV